MKALSCTALAALSLVFTACQTAETAATGTANTVGHAAQGVGRTARTLGTGTVNTVGNTASTAILRPFKLPTKVFGHKFQINRSAKRGCLDPPGASMGWDSSTRRLPATAPSIFRVSAK